MTLIDRLCPPLPTERSAPLDALALRIAVARQRLLDDRDARGAMVERLARIQMGGLKPRLADLVLVGRVRSLAVEMRAAFDHIEHPGLRDAVRACEGAGSEQEFAAHLRTLTEAVERYETFSAITRAGCRGLDAAFALCEAAGDKLFYPTIVPAEGSAKHGYLGVTR
jgi:hypothetical protein